jgi:hypothetical protein
MNLAKLPPCGAIILSLLTFGCALTEPYTARVQSADRHLIDRVLTGSDTLRSPFGELNNCEAAAYLVDRIAALIEGRHDVGLSEIQDTLEKNGFSCSVHLGGTMCMDATVVYSEGVSLGSPIVSEYRTTLMASVNLLSARSSEAVAVINAAAEPDMATEDWHRKIAENATCRDLAGDRLTRRVVLTE